MTTDQTRFPPKSIQTATFAVRLLTFLIALGMFGTFFLPWLHLDGHDTPSSGAQLITTILSPEYSYLTAVSRLHAWAVVGCPVIIFVAVAVVAVKKHQREPSPVAECIIIALSGVLAYFPSALTAEYAERFSSGLFALIVIAVVLFAQDLLTFIRDRAKLEQRAPGVDNLIGVISASGRYDRTW